MNLPGKMAIAMLEEDNPVKSYFRVKPLFVLDSGIFPVEDAQTQFPGEGFLRIVPDKNESSHFKIRMREMGAFCALDLRLYSGENEKIRPNKNYDEYGNGDGNAMIIYSDVIVETPEGVMGEIVSDPDREQPQTGLFLLKNDKTASGPWTMKDGKTEKAQGYVFREYPEDAYTVFSVPLGSGERKLAVAAKGRLFEALSAEPKVEREVRPEPAAKPVSVPAPAAQPQFVRKPRTEEEHSGLNPRRKSSIYELIDAEWSRSRLDQLGCPVPGNVTAMPVESPVEHALKAVKALWNTSARPCFLTGLQSMEGFDKLMTVNAGDAANKQSAACGCELEADRLKLVKEIDDLKRRKTAEVESVAEEVKRSRASETAAYEKKLSQLQNEIAEAENRLQKINAAASETEKHIDSLTDEKMAAKLTEYRLVTGMGCKYPAAGVPETIGVSAGELMSGVRVSFEKAGFPLGNDAVALALSAIANNRIVIISGKTGSGKTTFGKLLIKALGCAIPDALLTVNGNGADWVEKVEAFLRTERHVDAPHFVFIDNANLRKGLTPDIVAFCEDERYSTLRFILTVQDDGFGYPIMASLLDRAAFVRLDECKPAADVFKAPVEDPKPVKAVSMSGLKKIFAPEAEISGELKEKLLAKFTAYHEAGFVVTIRAMRAVADGISAVSGKVSLTQDELIDTLIARELLPYMLATGSMESLKKLSVLLKDMPVCLNLMKEPLPLPPL